MNDPLTRLDLLLFGLSACIVVLTALLIAFYPTGCAA